MSHSEWQTGARQAVALLYRYGALKMFFYTGVPVINLNFNTYYGN